MSVSALSDIHSGFSPRADDPRREPDPEPFGQRGVRQYVGVVVHWLCIVSIAVALTFWYRSVQVFDRLEWRGTDANLRISSRAGRIEVETNTFLSRGGRAIGWIYKGGTIRRGFDAWPPSVLKTVGIEFTRGPTRPDAIGGSMFRVKWYFVIAVLAIVPLSRGAIRRARHRRESREEVE